MNTRLILIQAKRNLRDDVVLSKQIQFANYDAGIYTEPYILLEKGRVIGVNSGKKLGLRQLLSETESLARRKNVIVELHITNTWYLAGPMVSDIVIDLEKDTFKVNIIRAKKIVGYLKMYGVKAAVKVSSIVDDRVGLHIYADLSKLWQLSLEEKWQEKWQTFYENLLKRLSNIYSIPPSKLDPAFKSEHKYRAFYSPRSLKGKPSVFNCYNIPIAPEEYIGLGEAMGWDLALEALRTEATSDLQPNPKMPYTGIIDVEKFLFLVEYLSQASLNKEVREKIVRTSNAVPYKRYLRKQGYGWIRRIIKRGLADGRKRFIYRCAAPYLAQRVREGTISMEEAFSILQGFVEESKKRGAKGKIYRSSIRAWLSWAYKRGVKPMSLKRFIEEYPDLKDLVIEVLTTQAA